MHAARSLALLILLLPGPGKQTQAYGATSLLPAGTSIAGCAGSECGCAESRTRLEAVQCIQGLEAAGDQGDIDAAFALGTMYEAGLHQAPISRMLARHWFHVAAEGGHAEAQERLDGKDRYADHDF
ncbi:sel1 repeat family protein [Stenotrophomonas sp. SAM-B]|uniref:sel1 repeat family protein n=1 Tax=Stenotrophomonas sp. SAM-B TaxID=2729141 RepID=UPI0015A41625|nr:sel1 repeat family protein [Stenotrophomonas sp. SAM-B]NWF32647.1 sel1 repeat family protein [Stenotrophomonas sp. SAM-B]